ncbi:MAG: DUF1802 family protein [Dehalococcoidia bacterium]
MRPTNVTALKEWSSVVEALKSGRQIILLRKGGLADKGRVFAVEDDEFFLYPTYLHQQVEFIKPECVAAFQQASATPSENGAVTFDSYAVVHESVPVASEATLRRLDALHIWNERFIEHRLQWKPDNPAWVVLLRAYRLAEPLTVEEQRRYRGCRSWVRLEEALPTDQATPVLSDDEFARRAAEVKRALAD